MVGAGVGVGGVVVGLGLDAGGDAVGHGGAPPLPHCVTDGPGALTTSVAPVVRLRLPLAPVIVSGYGPGGVLEPVVTLSVDEMAAAGIVEAAALAPAGNPLTPSVTAPVNPPVREAVTV
jgi:hypothetical protein